MEIDRCPRVGRVEERCKKLQVTLGWQVACLSRYELRRYASVAIQDRGPAARARSTREASGTTGRPLSRYVTKCFLQWLVLIHKLSSASGRPQGRIPRGGRGAPRGEAGPEALQGCLGPPQDVRICTLMVSIHSSCGVMFVPNMCTGRCARIERQDLGSARFAQCFCSSCGLVDRVIEGPGTSELCLRS